MTWLNLHTPWPSALRSLLIAGVLILAPLSAAQETPPVEDDPAAAAEDDAPPSLDDLLGIEGDGDDAAAERIADEQHEAALQQALDEVPMTDAFTAALSEMQRSAVLLDEQFDSGLGTQRVQEDILRKLDSLIDRARKMQQQQQNSRSQSQSNPNPQPQQQQTPPQQSRDQNQQNNNRRDDGPQDGSATTPPDRRDGEMNQPFEEAGEEWGDLPERVRDMLLQGRQEKFSSLYERLTREYYRKLAEDSGS
jgi:hypothetical protein